MLRRPLSGPGQEALADLLATLAAHFRAAGAEPLDVPHLFAGDTLLDLYGEDLRARAFLFPDAERGNELCLRPDFTVPVALAHGAAGWDRQETYCYSGPVFRRQPQGQGRPTEYLQAGIESFGDDDTAAADARIYALLRRGLETAGVSVTETQMGDLSIPFALLDALDMPDRRRAALRRHFWRPNRFQALLDRACSPPEPSPTRAALLAGEAEFGDALGLRTVADIQARIEQLAEETAAPPMPTADARLIDAVLQIDCAPTDAPRRLRDLSSEAGLAAVTDRFEARLDALAAEGVAPGEIRFSTSFGRNLEYYDGFVFEIRAAGTGEHPPLAGGGRYDALTAKLGAASQIPAIGGIIRPEPVLEVTR
ncbi:MAG: ATP phosphoribosyltransferase regulatory subunit [Pseudomonadota bacterium]